jgi:hypothetical protein
MILLHSSSGKKVQNPTLEEMRFCLFDDPAAWTVTPDCSIDNSDGETPCSLLITYHPKKGYYVRFVDESEGLWVLVCERMQLGHETVKIDDCLFVSKGFVCDKQGTWTAVEWFCKNGSRCPSLDWLSDKDMPPGASF